MSPSFSCTHYLFIIVHLSTNICDIEKEREANLNLAKSFTTLLRVHIVCMSICTQNSWNSIKLFLHFVEGIHPDSGTAL